MHTAFKKNIAWLELFLAQACNQFKDRSRHDAVAYIVEDLETLLVQLLNEAAFGLGELLLRLILQIGVLQGSCHSTRASLQIIYVFIVLAAVCSASKVARYNNTLVLILWHANKKKKMADPVVWLEWPCQLHDEQTLEKSLLAVLHSKDPCVAKTGPRWLGEQNKAAVALDLASMYMARNRLALAERLLLVTQQFWAGAVREHAEAKDAHSLGAVRTSSKSLVHGWPHKGVSVLRSGQEAPSASAHASC